MKTKKIVNIVFYNFYEDSKEIRQACLFYNDGTVENCSFDEGIDHTLELLKEQKVTSGELSNIINNKNIHVMSGKELNSNLQKFIVKEETPVEEIKEEIVVTPSEKVIDEAEDDDDDYDDADDYYYDDDEDDYYDDDEYDNDEEEDYYDDDEYDDKNEDSYDSLAHTDYEDEDAEEEIKNSEATKESSSTESKNKNVKFTTKLYNFFDRFLNCEEHYDEEKSLKVADEVKTKPKKEKISTKVKSFFHKTKVRVAAVTLSIIVALTGGLIIGKNEGKINKFLNNALSKDSTNKNNNTNNDNNLVYGDNDYYDDYSYVDLLKVNTNSAQRNAMQKINWAFTKFNNIFANSHVEEGKNIKAALSWIEMNSLQQAYNEYSTEDIKAIFNGSVIKANEFSQAYKNANLQLMGAHVIETRQNPVDLSILINSEEGKAFYRKYHEMFLQIKEAEGQDKIDKVNAWRQSLLEDFPISDDVREVGIAHSDSRLIEPYKLSIVPMVSAVEIMYQNLATDNTLSEKTINYFNDTGLCNLADDTFERIERITEVVTEDNTQPLYVQYESAITSELEAENNYNIADADRELTQLDAFQEAVNKHNHNDIEESSSTYVENTSEVYTTTKTHTVTTTDKKQKKEKTKTSDRDEAIEKSSKEEVEKAEEKVDQEIAKENEEAKETAETQAEEKRKELQSEADEHTKQVEEQVAQDAQDLQEDINKANDKIAQNNSDTDNTNDVPVNEQDFGDHNVDFDENYSDEYGNLDDSVKDLTTDSTKDQSNEPLPDPNVTGEAFEESYPKESIDPEYVPQTQAPVEAYVYEEENTVSDQADSIITYEEPVAETIETIEYAEIPETISNEELADMIVEDMANNPELEYEEGYQYVLR